jgi:hypothetical protein
MYETKPNILVETVGIMDQWWRRLVDSDKMSNHHIIFKNGWMILGCGLD